MSVGIGMVAFVRLILTSYPCNLRAKCACNETSKWPTPLTHELPIAMMLAIAGVIVVILILSSSTLPEIGPCMFDLVCRTLLESFESSISI